MSKVLGVLGLISVALSLVAGYSVTDPATAFVTFRGEVIGLNYVTVERLGFVDGLKNGSIVIGSSLKTIFTATIKAYRLGFNGSEVFGSTWLRKVWWLLGIPILLAINMVLGALIFLQSFALIAFTIKGGVPYYLGLAISFLILLAAGYAGEHAERGIAGQQNTETGPQQIQS